MGLLDWFRRRSKKPPADPLEVNLSIDKAEEKREEKPKKRKKKERQKRQPEKREAEKRKPKAKKRKKGS